MLLLKLDLNNTPTFPQSSVQAHFMTALGCDYCVVVHELVSELLTEYIWQISLARAVDCEKCNDEQR